MRHSNNGLAGWLGVGAIVLGGLAAACGAPEMEEVRKSALGASNFCASAGGGSGPIICTVSFSEGAAYSGASDATIVKASPMMNLGTSPECVVDAHEDERACLLHWDVFSIPSTAQVQRALIQLEIFNPSPATFNVHEVKRFWFEPHATWPAAFQPGMTWPWETPGAKGAADRAAANAAVFVGNPGTVTIPLATALAQSWVANAATNYGVIIENATTGDGIKIRSSEAPALASRPKLTITFLPNIGVSASLGDD